MALQLGKELEIVFFILNMRYYYVRCLQTKESILSLNRQFTAFCLIEPGKDAADSKHFASDLPTRADTQIFF